jgi:hypothetical protein
VLFVLPSRTREDNLHRRLAADLDSGVTVATTSPDSGAGPAGAVWRLAGGGPRLLSLAQIPSHDGTPGPFNPGPPSADDDPLAAML